MFCFMCKWKKNPISLLKYLFKYRMLILLDEKIAIIYSFSKYFYCIYLNYFLSPKCKRFPNQIILSLVWPLSHKRHSNLPLYFLPQNDASDSEKILFKQGVYYRVAQKEMFEKKYVYPTRYERVKSTWCKWYSSLTIVNVIKYTEKIF